MNTVLNKLYHTYYILKFPYSIIHTEWENVLGQTKVNTQSNTHRVFLQLEFVEFFPIKLENQLNITFDHTQQEYSMLKY